MNNSDLFERKAYKKAALAQLKGNWTVACVVALITLAVIFTLNIGNFIDSIKNAQLDYGHSGSNYYFNLNSVKPELTTADYIGLAVSLISLVLMGLVNIVYAKSYLDLIDGKSFTYSGFVKNLDLWAKGILEMLWSALFIFLWSLLLYIPGIIKAYAYSQAFFILAEYPEVSVKQALKISQKITKGYKGDLFVMDLSFIGWSLLAVATAGIGFIWLVPYIQTTKTNAFKFLMRNAFEKNRVSYEEVFGTHTTESTTENTNESTTENTTETQENTKPVEIEIPKVILCEDLTNKTDNTDNTEENT
ncbi:MAG: DUF975 family protein [Treponemataceae bacterium]|nr:DUF975 family protein [Treponemataceae bacterium]